MKLLILLLSLQSSFAVGVFGVIGKAHPIAGRAAAELDAHKQGRALCKSSKFKMDVLIYNEDRNEITARIVCE